MQREMDMFPCMGNRSCIAKTFSDRWKLFKTEGHNLTKVLKSHLKEKQSSKTNHSLDFLRIYFNSVLSVPSPDYFKLFFLSQK